MRCAAVVTSAVARAARTYYVHPTHAFWSSNATARAVPPAAAFVLPARAGAWPSAMPIIYVQQQVS